MVNISSSPKMFGAYVTKISTSIGFGGQGGSCQMTLIEDPDNDVVINLPEVGTACYFNFAKFQFGGVFQRHTYKESLSGNTYDIVLESPAKLLDGVQIILDGFEGTSFLIGSDYNQFSPSSNPNFTTQLNNVWNPFGHRENFAFGGIFGGANVNSVGFPAPDLLELIQDISEGGSDFGGPAVFGESEYKVDVDNLREAMTKHAEYFRVKGPVQNLNGILQECCELLVLDYFVTVVGKVDGTNIANLGDGGGVIDDPTITIKLVDKSPQPEPGLIKSFIEDAKTKEKLISADTGREFSDNVTQKVVIGGNASRYVDVPISSCKAVWGKVGTNAYLLSGRNIPDAYAHNANVPIIIDGQVSSYSATVFEVRMALAGQKEWEIFKQMESIAHGTINQDPWCAGLAMDEDTLNQVANGNFGALAMVDTSARTANKAYNNTISAYVQKIYNGVKSASEFYGKMFFAPLPYEPGGINNNIRWISEEYQYETVWDIAESAFSTTGAVDDASFYDGDGRLKSMAVWEAGNDFSALGTDHTNIGGDIASTKGGPQKDLYWFGSQPAVLFDAGAQVRAYDGITTPDFGLTHLAAYFFQVDLPPASYITPGKADTQVSIPPDVAPPSLLGIPQQSNRYKWGPWYAYGALNGKAEVIMDEALVPEAFGHTVYLDQAARATAYSGTATMFATESGYVELAEAPEFNIADRFATLGPYVTNMDMSIGTDGLKTTYRFNTWTPNFGKLTKYNIDRISRIKKAALAFLHKDIDKRPKRPFPKLKFEKTDFQDLADRFKWSRSHSWSGGVMKEGSWKTETSQMPLASAGPTATQDYSNSYGCTSEQRESPLSIRKGEFIDDIWTRGNVPSPGFQQPALGPIHAGMEQLARDNNTERGAFGGNISANRVQLFNSELPHRGQIGPTINELDPYFPKILDLADVENNDPCGVPQDRGDQFFNAIDMNAVVNEDGLLGTSADLNVGKLGEARASVGVVRTMGLRGPLILSGWGYDIADQPVPRDTDDGGEPLFGPFDFEPGFQNDRSTWKTGPIHLMWDDERQVWAGGLQVVCGFIPEGTTISAGSVTNPTTFNMMVMRKNHAEKGRPFFRNPDLTESESILVWNRDPSLDQTVDEDTWCICIKINYEWMPIWVGCP